MNTIYIRNATIVTLNGGKEILKDATLKVNQNRISALIPEREFKTGFIPDKSDTVIDARGCVILPGFVQTHVHLCQTLFRGLADDLHLLDWLQKKIFPFEAAHDERSMHSSALVGIAELIRSGTTTILDMGSIRHEEEIIRAIGESGLRAYVGKAMMDLNDAYPRLRESTRESLSSTRSLADKWHNSFDGRVRYAPAPRFVLSCTEALLREVSEMVAGSDGIRLHTHASEQKGEIDAVRSRCGMENIEYLHHVGLLSEKSSLAHCVHLNERETALLASTRANVTHCPSSNLKLGSGIANVPYLRSKNINVSLGADGAPCNNRLDMFTEMRLASLLQKPQHGPTAMPAIEVLEMATIGGARALGLDRDIGTIEIGKKADLVLLDLRQTWNSLSNENLYSSIVYSATPENVDSVMVDGQWLYQKKAYTRSDVQETLSTARGELKKLLSRADYN